MAPTRLARCPSAIVCQHPWVGGYLKLGSELNCHPPLESSAGPYPVYLPLATPGSVGQNQGGLESKAEKNKSRLLEEHIGGLEVQSSGARLDSWACRNPER